MEYPHPHEDVPATQLHLMKEVRKFGMIKKKTGGMKIPLIQSKYDLRFVVITKGWVYYYKEKTSEKPQGKFSLQGFSNTVINAEEEESLMPFVFKVYSKKANERTWFFATETKAQMEEWMEAFRLEIEQYNMKATLDIRPSKSCPVNPLQKEYFRPDINNGRPQSIHNVPPMQNHLNPSQLSSHTNLTVTSGIGSSISSIGGPEDDYEPVDVFPDDADHRSPFHSPHPDPMSVAGFNASSSPKQYLKPLPPVPEPTNESRHSFMEDFPTRPPPLPPSPLASLPPNSWTGQMGRNDRPVSQQIPPFTEMNKFSSSHEKPLFSPPERKQFSPLSFPASETSRVVPPPNLPPKPSAPKDQRQDAHQFWDNPLARQAHNSAYYSDNYNDTSPLPEYDDSLVQERKGLYDLPDDGQSYEPNCPEVEMIPEIVYEEEINRKPLPVAPTAHGIKPGTSPVPMKIPNRTNATNSNTDGKPPLPWHPKPKSPTVTGAINQKRVGTAPVANSNTESGDVQPAWTRAKLKPTTNLSPTEKSSNLPEANKNILNESKTKSSWVKNSQDTAGRNFKSTAAINTGQGKHPWQKGTNPSQHNEIKTKPVVLKKTNITTGGSQVPANSGGALGRTFPEKVPPEPSKFKPGVPSKPKPLISQKPPVPVAMGKKAPPPVKPKPHAPNSAKPSTSSFRRNQR